MSDKDYDIEIRNVLVDEGGNDDDPNDPGGRTSRGIIQREYDVYRKNQGLSRRDVWLADQSEILDIYRTKYWEPLRCQDIVAGLDYPIFDYGINSGIGRSPRVAQTLLGLPVTGRIDLATVTAINKANPSWFINAMCDERLHYMQNARGGTLWVHYRKGWTHRVEHVRSVSLQLAGGQAIPEPKTPPAKASPKAKHTPSPKFQKNTGTGTAGGTGAVIAAHQAGLPLKVALAIGAAVIIGGVVTWVVYEQKIKTANNKVVLPPGVTPRPAT
jgi:lysozyme family protein